MEENFPRDCRQKKYIEKLFTVMFRFVQIKTQARDVTATQKFISFFGYEGHYVI